MDISVKRIYDPAAKSDGTRVLVDRLWPRGISKDRARVAAWLKEVAPSAALRTWFHADPEHRFKEFAVRYRRELTEHRAEIKAAFAPLKGKITWVTAVKDLEHSHVPVLRAFVARF